MMKVHGLSAEGRVEIDKVQPICACFLPFPGKGDGVVRINGLLGGESALEAHDFTTHQIDRRK